MSKSSSHITLSESFSSSSRNKFCGTFSFVFITCLLLRVIPANAQLDETCKVMVNNQVVSVGFGGEFRIPNIPASNNLVRVYAVCTKNGKTRYGRSSFYQVVGRQRYVLSELDMVFRDTPFPSIAAIKAKPDSSTLTRIGQATQVRVTAMLSDSTQTDVTSRGFGSTYTSSNPNIATVNQQGIVTAVAAGNASITVNNEGATAVTRISVSPGDPLTTVEGFVQLEDGTPVEGVEITVTNVAGMTLTGPNGFFSIPEVASQLGLLTVTAQKTINGFKFTGGVGKLSPMPGGITDAGIITLLCEEQFIAGLFQPPGTGSSAGALTVFDDGNGQALYVGGSFTTAGGDTVNQIARWDGMTWSSLGIGLGQQGNFSTNVKALIVFDDGMGPALYAGGFFTLAGGVAVNNIAKWDGVSWSTLGAGLSAVSFPMVNALAVFDDGNGSALYAGGSFTTAGGSPANRIAKWNGATWSPLGTGLNGIVSALTVFDDGNGPALYVGGSFTTAGGVPASRVAKWDGTSWLSLGSGVNGNVNALSVNDDGNGPALFVGGSFTMAGGISTNRIAKWNGSTWSALGTGTSGSVFSLTVFDNGISGSALYAGGNFDTAGGVSVNNIARWDGTSWSPLGTGVQRFTSVSALNSFNDGRGLALYAGGSFTTAGDVPITYIAKWDGTNWLPVGNGLNNTVYDLTVFNDGTGQALYAGGLFTTAGDEIVNRIVKWNGTTWSPLRSGMNSAVNVLSTFDDGTGPALYAGGTFSTAGGITVNAIAKWDGTAWSALGSGMADGPSPDVNSMIVFNDGTGPALYVGGHFASAGGIVANNIAKWNGNTWSRLGSGLTQPATFVRINALAVFDDGGGPALFAGGNFNTAGGVSTNNIAKWNGTSWSPLGGGLTGLNVSVAALAVFDDGKGPLLYAGGNFTSAGGAPVAFIAKWDGTNWSSLGSPINGSVFLLTVLDDGRGPALYVGGNFTIVGGMPIRYFARWNGSTWSPVGSGVNNFVSAITLFDDGMGQAFYLGGSFTRTGGVNSSYLAKFFRPEDCLEVIATKPIKTK